MSRRTADRRRGARDVALPHPTAYSLGYIKHLGGAATHHLCLLLMRQGTKQPVDVLLGLKSYGPNMREVRAPQDTVSTYQRDHLRTIRIIDQPMIDACPHVVARLHLEGVEMHAWAETVRVLQAVQVPHEVRDPRQLKLAADDLEIREAVQNTAKNEVIGEHSLDFTEELEHATRILTAFLRSLCVNQGQRGKEPAGEDVQRDGRTRFVRHGPEAIVDGVPIGWTAKRRLAVNHRAQQALV